MEVVSSILDLVGNTPLLDLSRILPEGSARVLAKLEMYNPGGSIKDRPAMAMIEAAERDGLLKPGMTIVEPTAGNTGIGLALVGNLKGYRTVFFVPDRMSAEKIMSMKLYGAEVVLVPKEVGMKGCIQQAKDYTDAADERFMPQQFENPANPGQAETRLGPEIYQQLGAYPDGIALGAGSGGTFTGLARWMRANNKDGKCWLVQPEGSIFDGGEPGNYQIEGIGNSFIPETLKLDLADFIATIPDQRSFDRCKQLSREFGLLGGGSCGANLEASAELALQLGPGKTVVTIFSDALERYISKDWVQNLANEE